MPDYVKTEQLHVVPKADVDRMFDEMYKTIKASSPLAQKLRGIAYASAFLGIRRTIISKPDKST